MLGGNSAHFLAPRFTPELISSLQNATECHLIDPWYRQTVLQVSSLYALLCSFFASNCAGSKLLLHHYNKERLLSALVVCTLHSRLYAISCI